MVLGSSRGMFGLGEKSFHMTGASPTCFMESSEAYSKRAIREGK